MSCNQGLGWFPTASFSPFLVYTMMCKTLSWLPRCLKRPLGLSTSARTKKKDREWETRLTAHRPFANLHASGNFYTSLGVAVPSRIPGIHAKDKPLGGVRFTVKGIFEIEGLRVTTGDRSFYSLSKPSDATCPAIKRYLDSLIPHCGF